MEKQLTKEFFVVCENGIPATNANFKTLRNEFETAHFKDLRMAQIYLYMWQTGHTFLESYQIAPKVNVGEPVNITDHSDCPIILEIKIQKYYAWNADSDWQLVDCDEVNVYIVSPINEGDIPFHSPYYVSSDINAHLLSLYKEKDNEETDFKIYNIITTFYNNNSEIVFFKTLSDLKKKENSKFENSKPQIGHVYEVPMTKDYWIVSEIEEKRTGHQGRVFRRFLGFNSKNPQPTNPRHLDDLAIINEKNKDFGGLILIRKNINISVFAPKFWNPNKSC